MRTLQRRRRCQKHKGADRDSAPDMLSHFFKEFPNYAFPRVPPKRGEGVREMGGSPYNDC